MFIENILWFIYLTPIATILFTILAMLMGSRPISKIWVFYLLLFILIPIANWVILIIFAKFHK